MGTVVVGLILLVIICLIVHSMIKAKKNGKSIQCCRASTHVQRLKDRGCRITKQRLMLLDIILEEDCSCCKEIYYKASKKNKNIGFATVYRLINMLEEIGAISRKNFYKVSCGEESNICTIEFEDNSVIELSDNNWKTIIQKGLSACGYCKDKAIRCVRANTCRCGE